MVTNYLSKVTVSTLCYHYYCEKL